MAEKATSSAENQSGASNLGSAMANCFGRMDEFNPDNEEWLTYIERLKMFFIVNNVPEDKKVASLVTLMGGKMYSLLKNLTAPTKPTEKSYKEIVEIMARQLTPKPIVTAGRYKFHKYEQEEGQSVRDFLAKIQKLAETCDFGAFRDEALRDKLVCGLRDKSIKRKLLGEEDLPLKKAIQIAVGWNWQIKR